MKKTKIICSIGPASCSVEVMSKMVEAGMNVARINFSHATIEERVNVVNSVNKVREITGKNIGILYDTKGPEFRCGMHENDSIILEEGKSIRLVKETVLGTTERFSVNHAAAINSLKVGSVVLLENGLMTLVVTSVEEDGVSCIIKSGGELGNKKSMSVPGIKLDIPFISELDKEDILYAATHEGDFLALSFVSCKEDVLAVRQLLKENNAEGILLISKIESQTGIDNLDEIIEVSDGIMVARGDLGVEVPAPKLPYYQRYMVKKCRENGKIAIVATEMLESMKKNIRPTRAEISDVANAVMNGTDAVMLSGETTTGNFPVETVTHMADICKTTEQYFDYDKAIGESNESNVTNAICGGAVYAANSLNAKVIVSTSLSGASTRAVSNLLPKSFVLANVTSQDIANKLALNYAVYPKVVSHFDSTDKIVEKALEEAKEFMNLKTDDVVVITGGFPMENLKNVNFMKIEVI